MRVPGAIAFSDDAKGIPYLLENLKPLAVLPQARYPVHQAILFGLVRRLPVFFRAQQAREFIRRPTRDLHVLILEPIE